MNLKLLQLVFILKQASCFSLQNLLEGEGLAG